MKSFKNSYKVNEKGLISLYVCNVGFKKCEPLYQWGPGVRDHYLIHYIVSGKGYYKVNNILYSIEKNDTFLIFPNTQITYYADKYSLYFSKIFKKIKGITPTEYTNKHCKSYT